ncbi:hypothetical protein EBR43_10830 [bacterium]|nr:hypothetical protein [bacterium]
MGVEVPDPEDLVGECLDENDPHRDLLFRFLSGLEYGHEEFAWPEWVQKDLLHKIKRGKRDAKNISKNYGDLSFRLKTIPTSQLILDNIESLMRRIPEVWFNRIMKNYRLDIPYKKLELRKPIAHHDIRLKSCLYLASVSPSTSPPLIMKSSKLLEGHHRFIAIATLGDPSVQVWVGRSNPIQRKYLTQLEKTLYENPS